MKKSWAPSSTHVLDAARAASADSGSAKMPEEQSVKQAEKASCPRLLNPLGRPSPLPVSAMNPKLNAAKATGAEIQLSTCLTTTESLGRTSTPALFEASPVVIRAVVIVFGQVYSYCALPSNESAVDKKNICRPPHALQFKTIVAAMSHTILLERFQVNRLEAVKATAASCEHSAGGVTRLRRPPTGRTSKDGPN